MLRRAPKPQTPQPPEIVRDRQANGHHVRLQTARGGVHLWWPDNYNEHDAGIVLYVHGYYTDVDRAWNEHQLASKFSASGQNALFIVPEAPAGNRVSVYWPQLSELLVEVRARADVRRPHGPLVVLAHSGGYRTAVEWLSYPELDQVVLIDGLYGAEDRFVAWAKGQPGRQLVIVGADTLRWTEALVHEVPDIVALDELPASAGAVSAAVRAQPMVYMRVPHGHMQLVEGQEVIPLLLTLSPLSVSK